MRTPVIVINFKSYYEIIGERGLRIARICERVANDRAEIAIAPPLVDLGVVCKKIRIPVLSQHVDAIEPGSFTGAVSPEAIKALGASGTLVNHSERRMRIADIDFIVKRCKKVGLETVVCTNNLEVSKACALTDPDFIAIEPPELIGGELSVTTADPKLVRSTVTEIKRVNPKVSVLCGAGVKTGKDVATAIELGTEGVLLASGVVKAKKPKQVLLDLVSEL